MIRKFKKGDEVVRLDKITLQMWADKKISSVRAVYEIETRNPKCRFNDIYEFEDWANGLGWYRGVSDE